MNFLKSEFEDIISHITKHYRRIVLLLVCFLSILAFRNNVAERVVVSGDSMSGTYEDGYVLVSCKRGLDVIHRFDVVVVSYGRVKIIKRVIGLPGEVITIADGVIYIDGVEVKGVYGYVPLGGSRFNSWLLSGDEFFLLGDNRESSKDSRDIGAVSSGQIKGKIIMQIFPFWK